MARYTEKVRIRLTVEELGHLKKCAGSFSDAKFKNGRENFSGYLREKLLAESNQKNRNLERQMKELRYELRKIGTNVNQIARKVNGGFGTPNDVKDLKNHLEQIEKSFEEFEKEIEEWN